jgi:uncharacterized protein (DUF2141 family)
VSLAAAPRARAAEGCQGAGPHVAVAVDGLRSTRGDLVVEIYPDDAKRFLAHKAQVASVHQKLTGLNPTVCLAVPAPGYYAVAVFHDENSDYKLNQNALGIPTEGFGLSNNPGLRLGKPSFNLVRVRIEDDMTLRIHLRYVLGGGSSK